jgi:uncharacterized membrane protein
MNTAILIVVFCLLLGAAGAILWPRRHTQEARVFLVVAAITGAVIALANAWKRSARLR